MSKIYSVFTFFILVLVTVSLSTQEVDVTGDWELTMETRRGEMTRTVHFEQEGENLTVTMEGPRGGEFTITYTGKVEGDTMSGEVQMGNFGSFEWKATRI